MISFFNVVTVVPSIGIRIINFNMLCIFLNLKYVLGARSVEIILFARSSNLNTISELEKNIESLKEQHSLKTEEFLQLEKSASDLEKEK